ncbi:ABC transporter family protein [Vibrio cholerae]|uniref:ABC transporter ATP-binding protein n=1 Tax=Vibrio cholerae TaxID=666 RepID=UPI0011D8CDF6|nr:ABC transporter ATP-binding protein [Vibrio cholerae]EGR2496928.1 ABC transporter ATP-binding protein [Vibrio cholerae]TXZ49453.1 ABC transporter ATP-binding protein [Vibrio cholerae]BCN20167.1 putative O-antigen export system, ATP binding protein [Vibrio cholerae]BCN20827.1 putative O-antigen export system, ATP binding protein [Vibrio cholerae]GHW26111.1 ABC transporter family protein [Vibrio cholerae]
MGKITVANVGKAYKQYPTRWSRLAEWVIPGKRQYHSLKWVMQDVSFDIEPGQAVGIIGINGAGKSTLLKMITGTTQPTTGSIEMTGRVAALLELGMGFHPEFSGRENVYMAGQLLGLNAAEITNLMPEIEAFAEIGDYIDQPVRVYSSGMQMRLAFSVATAVRPDILIVDEALSVGDAHFQHKSFDRIRQFRKQGTTLLIVSHDKQAIQSICDRAILLNAGRVELQDKPDVVMDYYNALLADLNNMTISQEKQDNGVVLTRSGSGEAELIELSLIDSNDQKIEAISVGQKVILKMVAKCNCDIEQLVFGYMIKDRLGQVIFGETSYDKGLNISELKSDDIIELNFHIDMNIGVGSYSISTALAESSTHVSRNYEWQDLALVFEVYNSIKKPFIGCSWLNSQVTKI